MKVLVTGATGNNGREVMKQLAALNVPTRALVRDKSKEGASIAGPNVEIVEGDFAKPETLEAAMEGVDSAFLISPGDATMVELQSNFVQAAVRAKLPRIVKFSVSGANLESPVPFGKWHAEVEKIIRESGIPFTFLRPNYFMQNFLAIDRGSIVKESKIYAPLGDAAISAVDVRDNAAVAARTLTEDGHEGQTYEITGPTAVNWVEAAETFTKVLGRPVTYVPITIDQARAGMLAAGMPEGLVDAMCKLYVPLSAGYAAEVADTVRTVGKKDPITFEQFVRDNAAAFSA